MKLCEGDGTHEKKRITSEMGLSVVFLQLFIEKITVRSGS
jgi:hypothetical protein